MSSLPLVLHLFLLLLLPSPSLSFFFPTSSSSGCGCVPCAPQPVCPQSLPVCPPIQACPQVPSACCDTCNCKHRSKRSALLSNATYVVNEDVKEIKNLSRNRRDVLDDVVKVDAKCNSQALRDIIIQNIDRVTSISKRRIQSEAERKLQGRFNVICARGDFSYITNTEQFCQQSVGDVTCYVFKQLSEVVRARLS